MYISDLNLKYLNHFICWFILMALCRGHCGCLRQEAGGASTEHQAPRCGQKGPQGQAKKSACLH